MILTNQEIEFSESFTFVWPLSSKKSLEAVSNYTLYDFNDLKPTQENLNVIFPTVKNSTISVGEAFILSNIGLNSFTVKATNEDGTTEDLITIQSGEIYYFILMDVSSSNGAWRIFPWGAGANSITSFNVTNPSGALSIEDGTVVAPGGTIKIDFNTILRTLGQLNSDGFVMYHTGAIPKFSVKQLKEGDGHNIKITNPTGADGLPTLDVIENPHFASTSYAGMTIYENIIEAINTEESNGTIIINGYEGVVINNTFLVKTSNQTPSVSLSGTLEVGKDLIVYNLIKNPYVAQAWVNFVDNGSSITILSSANVSAIDGVTGGNGAYNIKFTDEMKDANYIAIPNFVLGGNVKKIGVTTKTNSSVSIETFIESSDGTPTLVTANKEVSIVIFSDILFN